METVPGSLAAALALACPLTAWAGQQGRCRWCCGELAGRRTAWCSDRCRRAFEGEHLWRRARSRARRRAGRQCQSPDCASPPGSAVEIDHLDAIDGVGYGPSCKHHATNLRCLCAPCHRLRTTEQARAKAAEVPRI